MTTTKRPAPKMKIAYDIVYVPLGAAAFGGAERSLLDLASGAAAAGKRVLIAIEPALAATDFVELAEARNLEWQLVNWSPERSLVAGLSAAISLFRIVQPSIVHFNISWRRNNWIVPIVARVLCRGKLVGSMRAMPDVCDKIPRRLHFGFIPGLGLWRLPDFFIARIWAATMHVVVSVNRDNYPARLVSSYGFSRQRLRVILNGVEVPDAPQSQAERAGNRRHYGLQVTDFLICFVGRVSPEKGLAYLIEAMSMLPDNCRLVVVGDGGGMPQIRQQIAERALSDRITLLGVQRDPYQIMGASDVVAVPSIWNEAFGRVVAEAMGLGIPVVASGVGGMAELIVSGTEGYLVPPGDALALRDAIHRIYCNAELRRDMGIAARRTALDRYSVSRVRQEYLKLYGELAPTAFSGP